MKKYINCCVYVILYTYLLLSYAATAATAAPPSSINAITNNGANTKPKTTVNNFTDFDQLDSIGVDEPFDYTEITAATPSNKNPDLTINTLIDNAETEVANPDNQFYIKHYFSCQNCLELSTEPSNIITTLDIQAIKRNAYVQLTPFKTDTISSTYEYLIVTYVEKTLSSSSPPMHNVSAFKPITQKHFYITPMTRKINHNVLPISAHFLPSLPPPSNNEKTPHTYHVMSEVAADDDDEGPPPFPIPLPGVGDLPLSDEDIGPIAELLFLNANERGYISPRLIRLFTLMNKIKITLKSMKADEAPPFPIPLPGVGKDKEQKYIFIATHTDKEAPPFPIPLPGVGDTVEKAGIKETITDKHQYILIPINNIMTEEDNVTEEHSGDVTKISPFSAGGHG